jgi:hypothetical protein
MEQQSIHSTEPAALVCTADVNLTCPHHYFPSRVISTFLHHQFLHSTWEVAVKRKISLTENFHYLVKMASSINITGYTKHKWQTISVCYSMTDTNDKQQVHSGWEVNDKKTIRIIVQLVTTPCYMHPSSVCLSRGLMTLLNNLNTTYRMTNTEIKFLGKD